MSLEEESFSFIYTFLDFVRFLEFLLFHHCNHHVQYSAAVCDQYKQSHKKTAFKEEEWRSRATDGTAPLEPWYQHHGVSQGIYEETLDTEAA